MERVLQRRLENSFEPDVESGSAIRLFWRALGNRWPQRISCRRKQGAVGNFGNRFERALEPVRKGRFADSGRFYWQKLAESQHQVLQRRLEQFRACSWLQLVCAVVGKRQDHLARRIRHELSGIRELQRGMELQQSEWPELWSELHASWIGKSVLPLDDASYSGPAAGLERRSARCRADHATHSSAAGIRRRSRGPLHPELEFGNSAFARLEPDSRGSIHRQQGNEAAWRNFV